MNWTLKTANQAYEQLKARASSDEASGERELDESELEMVSGGSEWSVGVNQTPPKKY